MTSTYTAETRYSSVSPARTYEYAKETVTNLPHDERIPATPTMYTEVRAFEIPKPKGLAASLSSDPSNQRATSRGYSSFLDSRSSPSGITGYDAKDKIKLSETGSSFTTDSRRYDPKSSTDYRDLDSSSYSIRQYGTENAGVADQKEVQLKYFGEEPIKSDGSKPSRSDIDKIKSTYEPYRSAIHDIVPSSGYVRSKLDSDKLYSNGYLKHDDESSLATKGPSFEAPIIASYGRAKSDIPTDRQQRIGIPSTTILERSEEMERLPRNWQSAEQMDTDIGSYRKKLSTKDGKVEMISGIRKIILFVSSLNDCATNSSLLFHI